MNAKQLYTTSPDGEMVLRRNFWKAAAKGMYHRSITSKYWDMDMGEVIAERDALRLALAEATGSDPGETDGENVHTALLQALEILDHQDEVINTLANERNRYAVALETIAKYLGVKHCGRKEGCSYGDPMCNDMISTIIGVADRAERAGEVTVIYNPRPPDNYIDISCNATLSDQH